MTGKLEIEIRCEGEDQAVWFHASVPRVGDEIMIGNRVMTIDRVIWSKPNEPAYDAWVQVLGKWTSTV